MAYARRHRMYDSVTLGFLPAFYSLNWVFQDLNFGFWIMKWWSAILLYIRIRDKTLDPDFKEAYE